MKKGYECDECMLVYDDQQSAVSCCPTGVNEGWQCEECDSFYSNETEARQCEEKCLEGAGPEFVTASELGIFTEES